jgi:hypothetical protein
MSTQHTPGPWSVVEDRVPSSLEIFADKSAICECWRRADVATEMANARLIAAAPELLDALNAMIDEFEGCYADADPTLINAKAAIAKATGEK